MLGILDIVILIVIVCAAIFVLCYVAHNKDSSGGCTGNCGSCPENNRQGGSCKSSSQPSDGEKE